MAKGTNDENLDLFYLNIEQDEKERNEKGNKKVSKKVKNKRNNNKKNSKLNVNKKNSKIYDNNQILLDTDIRNGTELLLIKN